MNILAIVGSPRADGNTNYLVEQTLEEATRLGAKTGKVILSKLQINPCVGHENCATFTSCRQQDDAVWVLDKFYQADGVILATPVYWYNVSAQMKAFIDRNYFPYKHNKKCQARAVGLIVIAEIEGIEDTLCTLKLFIDDRFNIGEDKRFIVSGYANLPGEVRNNKTLITKARKLGKLMMESLKEGN